MKTSQKAKHAIYLGTVCAILYLAVYIARNVLSTVTPQMLANGFSESYIGTIASVFFAFYAVGQLINGAIGDRIKAKYMLCAGLLLAGVSNFIFPFVSHLYYAGIFAYAITGFFLSMIYGPMTKVISESTELLYATRCSIGHTFSSFLGSPIAGIMAAVLTWQATFALSSVILIAMALICFACFTAFERRGIVKYPTFTKKGAEENVSHGSVKILFKHQIVKYSLVSILTGIIRTSVVFWLPTYFFKYLGFSEQQSATIFTITTLIISSTAFITIFVYEKTGKNMNACVLAFFAISAACFAALYFIKLPILNIILIVLAIMAANAAASILWSIYCPSLADTGYVSSATGFLDFLSYMAAAFANLIFANAVSSIGWGNLILVWLALMIFGVIICLPVKRNKA